MMNNSPLVKVTIEMIIPKIERDGVTLVNRCTLLILENTETGEALQKPSTMISFYFGVSMSGH